MPAVFYIVGVLSFAGCAFFAYLRLTNALYAEDVIHALAFMDSQAGLAACAMTLALVSIVSFATGAVIETLRRNERDPE